MNQLKSGDRHYRGGRSGDGIRRGVQNEGGRGGGRGQRGGSSRGQRGGRGRGSWRGSSGMHGIVDQKEFHPLAAAPEDWSKEEDPNVTWEHHFDIHCSKCLVFIAGADQIHRVTKGRSNTKETAVWIIKEAEEEISKRVAGVRRWDNNEVKGCRQQFVICRECKRIGRRAPVLGAQFEAYRCGLTNRALSYKFFSQERDLERGVYFCWKPGFAPSSPLPLPSSSSPSPSPSPLSSSSSPSSSSLPVSTRHESSLLQRSQGGIIPDVEKNRLDLVGRKATSVLKSIDPKIIAWKEKVHTYFFLHYGIRHCKAHCSQDDFSIFISLLSGVYGNITYDNWTTFRTFVKSQHFQYSDVREQVHRSVLSYLESLPTVQIFRRTTEEQIFKALSSLFCSFSDAQGLGASSTLSTELSLKDKEEMKVLRKALFIPREHLYTSQNNGKTVITIDLRSANFNTLKLLEVLTDDSWEELVDHSNPPLNSSVISFFASSKELRMKTLGKIAPKRTTFAETILLQFIWNQLKTPSSSWSACLPFSWSQKAFLFSCDELVLEVQQGGWKEALKEAKTKLQKCLPPAVYEILRIEAFKLYQRNYTDQMKERKENWEREREQSQDKNLKKEEETRPYEADFNQVDLSFPTTSDSPAYFIRLNLETKKPYLKHVPSYLQWEALLDSVVDNQRAFQTTDVTQRIEQLNAEK